MIVHIDTTERQPAVFPFGDRSTPRPPRRPTGICDAFVLGVYPSAVHVRWDLPAWATRRLPPGSKTTVGALAVADEPTVFWDGAETAELIDDWKLRVGFRLGDDAGCWGHVRAAGNGTSGRPIADKILPRLGVAENSTWFSDSINEFFVKRGGPGNTQQGDVIDSVYNPFAREVGLPASSLPRRPTPATLVGRAAANHRQRLRHEIEESSAPILVTLGEEARQVLERIADRTSGPPTNRLRRGKEMEDLYGKPGKVSVGQVEAEWYALSHPGNRSSHWSALNESWRNG